MAATRQWTITSHDSSNSELQWRIWPKGLTYYSPDSGFKGEFEMMEIWKRDNRKAETKTPGAAALKQKQEAQQSIKEKKVVMSRTRNWVSWWYWVLGGLVLVRWVSWKARIY